MGKTKFYIYIGFLLGFIFSPESYYENYLTVALLLFGITFYEFISGFGKRIHPLDLMCLYATLVYVLSPSLLFHFTDTGWYEGYLEMAVSLEEYFSVAMPSTFMLLIGLAYPHAHVNEEHRKFLPDIAEYLKEKRGVGYFLFWVGAAATFLRSMDLGLGLFVELAAQLVYIGGLYIWFSPTSKNKNLYLIAVFLFPLVQSVQEAMFGVLVFWGLFLIMLITLRYKIHFVFKLGIIAFGMVVMLFLQSIKFDYRQTIQFAVDKESITMSERAEIMQDLWRVRVENPDLLFGPKMMSGAMDRTNQGKLVSMAISYVPASEPYADGETIYKHMLASLIPRFLWPDKPEVGGKANMIRFTGYDPGENTSMDIGPLGDAYVNFGKFGGAVFMFFYGLFFSFFLYKLFSIGVGGMWSMILWIPLFYTGAVQMDSSFLACVGHIIKSGMFTVIVIYGYNFVTNSDI